MARPAGWRLSDTQTGQMTEEAAAITIQKAFRESYGIADMRQFGQKKDIFERSWLCGLAAKCCFLNTDQTPQGALRSYAITRKFLMIVVFLLSHRLVNPLPFLANDVGNVIREDLVGELREDTDVVAARVMGHVGDHFRLQPVINGEDLVHMLNMIQMFCMDHNGANPLGAENHLCSMKVFVTPSPQMRFIYQSDAKGAKDAGWRQKATFGEAIDGYWKSLWDNRLSFPETAAEAERTFPRQKGIRCDEQAVLRSEVNNSL